MPATHIVYLYDRLLGITTSVTQPTPSQVGGIEKCCCEGCASSSYRIGACSKANYLLGKCCYQRACRFGGLNAEISADGEESEGSHTRCNDALPLCTLCTLF